MASPKKKPVKASPGPGPAGEVDLDELAAETAKTWVLASSLPDEFEGWLNEAVWKLDKRGNNCLFVTVTVEGVGTTVIKYTKQTAPLFEAALQKLGTGIEEAHKFLWRRYSIGRGFPRHYPVKILE